MIDDLNQKCNFKTGIFDGEKTKPRKYFLEMNEIFYFPLFVKKLIRIFEKIPRNVYL